MANNPPPEKKLDSFRLANQFAYYIPQGEFKLIKERIDYSSKLTRRRKRTVFKKEQLDILKTYFQNNSYPGIEEREELSMLTHIPEPRIHVWFQNRRARQSKQLKKRTSGVSTSLRNSCSFERRNTASVPEAPSLCGYGIAENYPFFSSQMMEPSAELQPCTLPRPMSQRSSSQWASSWTLQGTQGPGNYNTHTSFNGEVKPPLHIQDQSWTVKQLYSKDHSWSFRYAEELLHQLQQPHPHQPSTLQPLVLTSSQQSQKLQDQTLPPPLVEEEEQLYELISSFNQEELHPIDVSERTAGFESTLPDGHLPAPQGYLGDPLRDLVDHQGYLTDTQGHLADSIITQ